MKIYIFVATLFLVVAGEASAKITDSDIHSVVDIWKQNVTLDNELSSLSEATTTEMARSLTSTGQLGDGETDSMCLLHLEYFVPSISEKLNTLALVMTAESTMQNKMDQKFLMKELKVVLSQTQKEADVAKMRIEDAGACGERPIYSVKETDFVTILQEVQLEVAEIGRHMGAM